MLLAVTVALVGLLAGCRSSPTTSSKPSPAASSRLDGLLDRLTEAVTSSDRAAFDRLVSDRDPGFGSRAEMIYANLDRLRPTSFVLRSTGRTEPLSGRRADLLGTGSYAAEVQVSWAVPGDRTASDQTIWLTVLPEDRRLLWAGSSDGPQQPHPTPLWWLEPIAVRTTDSATVITGTGNDPDAWSRRARTATAQVIEQLQVGVDHDRSASPAEGWNRRLVLIVPSNARLLEQMLGVAEGSQAALAGVTWPDASELTRAPMRIMINPAGTGRSELGTDLVLAHEAVHVATRSPASPAPTWLVEGFADHIAYRIYPAAVGPAEDLVLSGPGTPRAELPADADFESSGGELDRTYALSWLACRYLAREYGQQQLFAFYRAVDDGASTEQASRQVFGVSQQTWSAGWQRWLARAGSR